MVSSSIKMRVIIMCALAGLFEITSCASVTPGARTIHASEDSRAHVPHSDVKNAVPVTGKPLDLLGSTASRHSNGATSSSREFARPSNVTLPHNQRVARANDQDASPSNKTTRVVSYDSSRRHKYAINSTGHTGGPRRVLSERQATLSSGVASCRGEHTSPCKSGTNRTTLGLKEKQHTQKHSLLHVGPSKSNSGSLGQESKSLSDSSSASVTPSKKKLMPAEERRGEHPKGDASPLREESGK
ncbi:hypothetical protein HPB51_023535 [Rhipicephalus microplus]|uniref:Secreted protein n=1 Tax=Rhipicephalus microplus TaxID=6941 RepID=A0A9J6F8M5_RHIMP|nr:hypothetical protein HPB51_023535 [Rhipicephalus microplus]